MIQTKKLLLVACLGWACQVQAEVPVFDLPMLERLGLESNKLLKAVRTQLDFAQAGVKSAEAYPNPELEYLRGQGKARESGVNAGNSHTLTFTQPLDLPFVRRPRVEAANAGLESAKAQISGHEINQQALIRQQFFDVLRREAELKNAREDVALMEKMRSSIALRVETGEAPRFELIKAEAESLNAQKVAQAAGFRVEQAHSMLRRVVGEGLPRNFELKGKLNEIGDIPSIESLKQEILVRNPELLKVRAELSRTEYVLTHERMQRLPKLAFKMGREEDPDLKTSSAGIVMTLPLWDRRTGPIGEAASQRNRARYELEATEFSMMQAIEVAYQQYEIAQAQVTALESGIVRQAENALKVAESAYRFGERGVLEVIDAQRVYRAARSELIIARYELANAWVEIERLRANAGELK